MPLLRNRDRPKQGSSPKHGVQEDLASAEPRVEQAVSEGVLDDQGAPPLVGPDDDAEQHGASSKPVIAEAYEVRVGDPTVSPAANSASTNAAMPAGDDPHSGRSVVLQEIRDLLSARSSYEDAMEQSFRMLYEDVKQASAEQSFARLRPLLLDLIHLLDRVEVLTGQEGVAHLGTVRDEVLEILERQGVVQLGSTSGDLFDAAVHRIVARSSCEDQTLRSQIRKVVRKGYALDGRVVRYIEVDVWDDSMGAGR